MMTMKHKSQIWYKWSYQTLPDSPWNSNRDSEIRQSCFLPNTEGADCDAGDGDSVDDDGDSGGDDNGDSGDDDGDSGDDDGRLYHDG